MLSSSLGVLASAVSIEPFDKPAAGKLASTDDEAENFAARRLDEISSGCMTVQEGLCPGSAACMCTYGDSCNAIDAITGSSVGSGDACVDNGGVCRDVAFGTCPGDSSCTYVTTRYSSQCAYTTVCDAIAGTNPLPSYCSCQDAPQSGTIVCSQDNIEAAVSIDVCGAPELVLYFDYGSGYEYFNQDGLPTSARYDIPELDGTMSTPAWGSLNFYTDFDITGYVDDIDMSITIGSCSENFPQVCNAQISSELPITLFSLTDFDLTSLRDSMC